MRTTTLISSKMDLAVESLVKVFTINPVIKSE